MSFPWEDDWGGVAVESDVPWEDTFKEEPPEPPLVLGQPEAPVAEVDSMRPVMAGEPVDLGPQRQLEPVQAQDAFPRLSPSELGMARAGIGAFERPKTLGEAVGRGLTSSPLSVVPPVEIPPESSFSKAAVLELANVAKSVPEFFTSAAGIATLFGAKIAPRLVSAGFSADMLLAGLKQAKQAYENWDQMTDAEKGVAVVDTTSALLFSGMAGAHAAGVKLKPAAKPEFQGPIATGEVLPMPRPAVPVRMPIQLPDAARVEPPPGVVVEAQPKPAPAVESSVRLVGTKSTAPWPYALVSKDPTGQGWRLTWFSEFEGKKAPQGHKDFPTREAALSEAKDLDFEEAPPAARPVEALPATAEAPPAPKPAEPAAPKIAEPKPTQAKEPWEMTRSEYGSEANRKALESPNLPPKPPSSYEVLDALEKRNNRKPYNPDLLTDESLGKLGDDGLISGSPKRAKFTEEGRARLYEWRRISEDRRLAEGDLADKAVDDALDKHKASVEKAIREGKPVPTEVLKDYPDLTTSPGTAVPKPVELSEPTPAPKPAASAVAVPGEGAPKPSPLPTDAFVGNLKTGQEFGGYEVLGNYRIKSQAGAVAAANPGTRVEGYLNGKWKRGWVVLRDKATATKPTATAVQKVQPTEQPAIAKVKTEVQKVAATEGQRPAKEIKEEYVQRVEDEINALIKENDEAGTTLEKSVATPESEGGARWSYGGTYADITKTKSGYHVATNVESPLHSTTGSRVKLSGTFKTLDEVEWFIKAVGSSGKGSITVDIPGDGITTIVRKGPSLIDVWKGARKLETKSEAKAKPVPSGGESGKVDADEIAATATKLYGDARKAIAGIKRQLASEQELEPGQRDLLERAIQALTDELPEVKRQNRIDELTDIIQRQEQDLETAQKRIDQVRSEMKSKSGTAKQRQFIYEQETLIRNTNLQLPKRKEELNQLRAQQIAEQPAPIPQGPGGMTRRESAKPEDVGETMEQRAAKADPFERARSGESSAFDELDEQFRNIWEDTSDIEFGRPNPNQVHTPKQFADRFNAAFAARDFDTILETIKATSDVSVWKPFLKDLFARQAKDPIAAEKADWMRHVFNGTRPPNAAAPKPPPRPHAAPPPVTPTPRPRPGAPPPPPPPPPQPPAPPPVRIPVDPIPGGGAKSPYKILEDFSAAIKKEIRVLRMKRNVLGVYKPGSTTTSERFAGDLDTAAHELAGHWTDDRYGIGKPWIAPRTRSPYDAELAKFWIHGSVKPSSSLRYRRAEGIAEFIRAYVVNPKQAKSDAPNFTAYFERTLPTEALKAINDFGTDVRRWAGEDPLVRAGLNIRMEPPTLTARLWKGLMGRGFGFEISPIDRLRLWFDDPYHFAVKADKAIRAVRGGRDLPSEQFELTARLLSTHDARMSDQFERGLVPLRPGQKPNAKGQLEVERSIDPVTNEPMTLKWLMGSFDTSSRDAFMKDMKDVSAFMVAQRTIEKAKILGKDRVSGIGAGIMSDVTAAKELLAKVSADPALKAKLEEGARRYRMWADHNLQMLVDGGRITAGQKRRIQAENQQYVDMHRLSSEFDVANFARRGGHIGTPSDVIKRFRGSTLELDNVYSNLLEQTDSIQKEAHRNVVMNNFTDGLRNTRNLHGPELKDFDQFGRKVTSADRNTITVYKNGKAEHWQFAPEIFESLKGLGDLQTNALWSLAMLPSRFARYMITRGPSFMIRNPLRDTFERAVNSRSSGKPWDILQGYSQRELSRYEVFGGGQFGNYIVDAHVWNREIKKVMREMVKDPRNILLSPLRLKDAWSALGEKSEKLGRVAEFRRAFDLGRKKLAADHPTMTPKELDYNAALYAAGEARALLDFAKAGTVMKYVNQAIPFSNAGVRGLAKSIHGMKTDPAGYAMRWAVHVLLPTLLVMLWNRRDDTTWKEYLQLPAYRRDFFWNLKVGDYWLTLPKPHLLGVLAGGVERIISSLLGDPNSGFGFASSLENTMPVSNIAESSGPLKTFLELNMNRDTFRSRDIVPPWEKDLDLDLRKGAKFASGAGQGAAGALNVIGLGIDPRQIDHVLRSMGGWGNIAMAVTARNRNLVDVGLQSTGLITQRPGANAEDVVRVMDWARQHGKTSSKDFQKVIQLRKQFFEATTPEAKEKARVALVNEAGRLRRKIDNALQK
jgi:hypothetical protein